MNTAQITHALEQDPVTSKKFCGVFPSDKLPQTIDRYPCGFVANTDLSSEPGTCKLQSAWSDVCGQYCIFYLSHRARGQGMSNIVHLFNNDTILNYYLNIFIHGSLSVACFSKGRGLKLLKRYKTKSKPKV